MSPEEVNSIITDRFSRYLQTNRLRTTPERWKILKVVYELKGHFDYRTIERKMIEKERFRVSRATIYNTIDHLIRANLLVKHQFSGESTYETVVGKEQHVHVVCTKCGSCTEIPSTGLHVDMPTGKKKLFDTHWVAYMFGECTRCRSPKKKEEKKQTKK
ncbi:MAG: transcriptional repressor [Paraprevotella sp.]|nr:transcriptional repressor [Paraprevotella sp.]